MNDPKTPRAGRGRAPGTPATAPPDDDRQPDAAREAEPSGNWEGEGGAPSDAPAPAVAGGEPDYKDRWLRAEADLQNYRRRATREWEEARRGAEESVLLEMVAALDDLERALEAAAGAEQDWVRGVALVAQRMREYLARQGVTAIDPLGQPFDPAFQEALLEIESPEGTPEGSVVKVVQKGYRRGDRALRAARVVVGRPPAGGAA
ncbi:MAG: nucleotide exchange factor GrpE [Candidatus Eisenbacteria bacterium]|uniref:Protein GrpE n=1 Tax=Eiseniibacteriota bacterium TaxID=2212470 RepID=A0A9D6L9R3_UNCEI|nr:nucleotide exchange factor GrpE [Candidatus Eisenbacteria bacterium]MBI3539238.1 nucleotide exchange factor GrpE [Candidatus Eisenbacteria bacterium]